MTHQVHHWIHIEMAAESELIADAHQSGEAGVSDIETVIELNGVAADAESALQVEPSRPERVDLRHHKQTAQGFDCVRLVVDPGENFPA
jgi:hypothetical protein